MNKVKCVLGAAVSALKRFCVDVVRALWQSWKWIWLQMLVWMLIEECLGVVGIRLYWGHFGILAEVFAECIVVYTVIYCFYARFVARRLWGKTFFYPYLLYCLLVYLAILWNNDWKVSIVTVDAYMLDGWFAPMYGLGCWVTVRLIKRYLVCNNHAVIGKVLHVGWIVLVGIITFICLLIPTILYVQEGRSITYAEPPKVNITQCPYKTNYTWEIDGRKYPIYMAKRRRAYIMRISKKDGKEHKYWLPDEVAQQIGGK